MFSFFKRKNTQDTPFILRQRITPLLGDMLRIDDIRVTADGQAMIVVVVTADAPDIAERFHQIEKAAATVAGIRNVMVIPTGNTRPSSLDSPSQTAAKSPSTAPSKAPQDLGLPPVVIAVASGKGGVGKSTVAVNLALALSFLGKRVGILDADIYGPSVPRLLGVSDRKVVPDENGGKLEPILAQGIKAMSMGFLVEEQAAMIWRGPMVQSALLQMIRDVNWSGVDILVIDLPPGTGDIHLTLAQRVPLSGGVVVSTPQDIALIDARKGLDLFQKVSVPILGIIENMSTYCCPNCGHREDIFGAGGAKAEAEKLGVPVLGDIPLHRRIRELSDAGTPIVVAEPDSPQAEEYRAIATRVLAELSVTRKPAPIIRIDE